MEPLSIIGAVAACAQLGALITHAATNIASLKRQWNDGERSLQLLIIKLSTIRAALTQIRDWSDFSASSGPNGEELRDNLAIAMEGCQVVVEALDRDVAGLLDGTMASRLRQLFVDSKIREHEERLSSQITAFNLLVSAAYCHNLAEQRALLEQSIAREVFQRIREDTSTVREQSTIQGSASEPAARPSRPVGTEASQRLRATRAAMRDSLSDSTSTISSSPRPSVAGMPEVREPPSHQQRRNSARQRPSPFEMLPYDLSLSSPTATTPSSRKSSGFFSFSRVRSSNTSLSADSSPTPPVVRRRLSKLVLPTTSSPRDETASSRSRLSLRIPGSLAPTDIYLRSENGQPPPKVIVAAQRGDHAEMLSLIRRGARIGQQHEETGRAPLAVASHCGHDSVVGLLLAEGAKIRSLDKDGLSPLHLAAANGHCDIIETLLSRDADINIRSAHGKTPLRVSCDHGQIAAARLLARRRAMVDARDVHLKTALHAACESGDSDIASLLLELGADKDAKDAHMRTPLHVACIFGRTQLAEILILARADIEAKEEDSMTPLVVAARSGRAAVVELLFRHKASAKARGTGDFTALHWASYNGHEEAASLVIGQRKTEIDARSINGRTPLHVATMMRSFGVVEKLIKAGAHIEAGCHEGNRPLHYACRHGTQAEVALLLNAGADCNSRNTAGESPLHVAVRAGATRIAKALVTSGAQVDTFDKTNARPLADACSSGHLEIVELLLFRGAVVKNAEDAPVCLAASGGHVPVIQALLQHGGAVRETDLQGWEPLRRAAYAGHVEAVSCLIGKGARATDLGRLESFSFASTAATEQRERITTLLREAVMREEEEYMRVMYLEATATTFSTPGDTQTNNPVELPEDDDRAGTPFPSPEERSSPPPERRRNSIPSNNSTSNPPQPTIPPAPQRPPPPPPPFFPPPRPPQQPQEPASTVATQESQQTSRQLSNISAFSSMSSNMPSYPRPPIPSPAMGSSGTTSSFVPSPYYSNTAGSIDVSSLSPPGQQYMPYRPMTTQEWERVYESGGGVGSPPVAELSGER